jgi:hypothetical protein
MCRFLGIIFLLTNSYCFADLSGFFVGGGVGYGIQAIAVNGTSQNPGTPAVKAFIGYQMADWIGIEAGYTYITQADSVNNLGTPSTTIYDLAFTPGFTIPATGITAYVRLGVDGISPNLNNTWYNQVFSSLNANFEWGLGLKVNIPSTQIFVRAEYIDYGSGANNDYSNMSVRPSIFLINAAYVF